MKMPSIPEIPNEEELESFSVHWLRDGGRIAKPELDYNLFLEHFKPLHAIATRQQKAIEVLSNALTHAKNSNIIYGQKETDLGALGLYESLKDHLNEAQKILDGEEVG